MVRPANFGFNIETAESNKFQKSATIQNVHLLALAEFDNMVEQLRKEEIEVLVFQDTEIPHKPDAIFPNNWLSFHPNGVSVLYPMEAKNRQIERRMEIFELVPEYNFQNNIDISNYESENKFLEGTGSIIFDHDQNKAYCAVSSRSNTAIFEELMSKLGFKAISFEALDLNGHQIYHTNVMLSIGDQIIVVCSESISDPLERHMVLNELNLSNKAIIDIDFSAMTNFAGNCLEINNKSGQSVLVMSETAHNHLTENQIFEISKKSKIVFVSIPTIESIGGGSARCMMLGVT